MIVSVSGFGWSGSGAVLDFLKEYSDIDVAFEGKKVDPEFILLSEVDGIRDLEYHLVERPSRISSYLAIQRYLQLVRLYNKYMMVDGVFDGQLVTLTEQYIDSLKDFELVGATYHEYYQTKPIWFTYNRYLSRILGNRISRFFFKDGYKKLLYEKVTDMVVSYRPEKFLELTKNYLVSIFSYLHKDKNCPLVFDQMLPADNPTIFLKYIDEPRCIVVRRDPRDSYLLAKCAYHSDIPIPTNTVDDFITFFRKIIQDTVINDNPEILNVQFEDMIYKYDETKDRIEKFLGISQHTKPKEFLKPEVSIQNTQLFRRYKGFEEDIRKIEEALPDSLYPFEKFPELKIANTQVF